ncbi:MAG: 23S rRNA (uracil(1939)-C(5))-methyltransferase RlmD, partial [Bacilli bacterium]|nr:23S rRNA (uracil(1939)-C(5))-methyltransferase RlmD [Bacilli bacterium]
MKTNEKYQGTCIDLNHQGVGVIKIDGFPVFIEDMLVDEVAEFKVTKVEKSFAHGTVLKHLKYSDWRVNPICPVYNECGGCNIMHLAYAKQLEFKTKMAYETFKRIGHLENVNIKEIMGMEEPFYYRNKVQIPFSVDNKKTICGFYKKKTHQIINLEKCFIQPLVA